jgi:LysM repeat protein
MIIIRKTALSHILLFLVCVASAIAQEQQSEVVLKYIERYKTIAIEEMKLYKIPASITLAQGILESNAGRSTLAVEGNNHFGIKCHNTWYGKTIIHEDDVKNECFRKYDTPEESFRDHSEFLRSRDRYAFLFELASNDYKAWALGLKQAGYATNPKYAELLIKNIELYSLFNFDSPDYMENKPMYADNNPQQPTYNQNIEWSARIYTLNNIRAVNLLPGETLESIGQKSGQGLSRILRYNDLTKNIRPADGSIIYLQPKRRRGNDLFHTVSAGDNMYTISQLHGIKLKYLYQLNNMETGTEPAVGEIIYLRNRRTTKPLLKNQSSTPSTTTKQDITKQPLTIEHINSPGNKEIDNTPSYISNSDTINNLVNPTNDNLSQMITMPDDAANYYTVKSGDTLYSIAKAYNLSVEKLREMNKLYSEIIHSGMRLRIRE